MTIEAKTQFLGKVVKKTLVEPGTRYEFIFNHIRGVLVGMKAQRTTIPYELTLEVLNRDEIRITAWPPPGPKRLSVSTRPVQSIGEAVFEREEINEVFIPSKIPGVRTIFKWTPTTEGK